MKIKEDIIAKFAESLSLEEKISVISVQEDFVKYVDVV
jgi:hypothetical protein